MLRRVQQLPEKTRKIILWTVVVTIAIILIAWLASGMLDRFTNI